MNRLLAALILTGASSLAVSGDNVQSGSKVTCTLPYEAVGDKCIYLDEVSVGTWDDMSAYCQEQQGHLVRIYDANTLEAIVSRIQNNTDWRSLDYWIGAKDDQLEGIWTWTDGLPVRMGTPFWANHGCSNIQAPEGSSGQNCAALFALYHHYMMDHRCTATAHPICEQL